MEIDAAQWPAFSLLMDQMLELPPGERAAWVCALTGDAAALAPQLLTMLQADADARTAGWLDTLPKLTEAALHTLMEAGTGYEQAGEEVGPYRLVRLLGRGGMGSVWYAERSDRLMRRGVALKLPMGGSPQMAARFERERDIIASLVHPNIARLYDAGVAASGQAYLALEYVEGQALDQYCDSRRLGLRARIALFAQVLGAVQYAHSRLVIHRDLKPTNILITNDGEVRLLDFGVAKMLDTEIPEASDLTRVSDAGMTLAYASPEQVEGRPVTTATDVYSLGVVLFELLVGVRPYRMKRSSRAALEEAILRADIPLASATVAGKDGGGADAAAARNSTVKRLRKDLQGDLDAILIKALSRVPTDRYETVASFADDLDRYCHGRVVRAHRRSRWYQLRKFVARNQIPVAATLATVVALTTATGIALWQAREAQRQAQLAATERDRALAAVEHRDAVDDFMNDLLLEAGRTGKPVSIANLIARADALSAGEFVDNPEARATVLKTVGQFDLDFEGLPKALADFELAEKMLADSKDTALRSSLACDASTIRGFSGHAESAMGTLKQTAHDPRVPAYVRSGCFVDLAQLAIFESDAPLAAEAISQALSQWDVSGRRSPYRYLQLLMYQAVTQVLNGQPGKAEAGYARIMTELKRLGRERGHLAYYVRSKRFDAAISSGDLPAALAAIDENLSISAQDFPDRAAPALATYERGMVLSDLGRYADAIDAFERAVKSAASGDQRIEQLALLDEAAVLSKLGRRVDAEQRYRSAISIGGKAGSGLVSGFSIARVFARAKLDVDNHQFRSAGENLRQALAASANAPYTLASLHRLRALANLGAGQMSAALEDARLALDISEKLRGDLPQSALVGLCDWVLGQVLEHGGDRAAARDAYATAVAQLAPTVAEFHPALVESRERLRILSGTHS